MKSISGGQSACNLTLAYTANDGKSDCLFVYNRESGGYVVVSGDERTISSILAYSDYGEFDYNSLPENAKYVIDTYSTQISNIEKTGTRNVSVTKSNDYPESVSPLLDPIAWNQMEPYNNYCPTINEEHCPTGCVATAMAQVMYFHKWPEKGKGNNSYYWTYGDKTLSADFSSSTYHWDLMTPMYNANSSAESCDAVAKLMSDCGIALQMHYNLSGSSAGCETREALVENFSYDKSIKHLSKNNCSAEYWHNTLKEELIANRPIIYSGGSAYGAHCFVCDGYQGDYFHFNFGWGGSSNMFCLTSATGFDLHQEIDYGIQKDYGGSYQLVTQQETDFVYKEGKLNATLAHYCNKGLTFEDAIAVENIKTHKIGYFCEQQGLWYISTELNADIADGDYIVYVVSRLCGNDTWNRVIASEYRQSFVNLNVTNGVKTFSNNNLYDEVREGVNEIDGVFYILNDNNTATVTYKNDNKASYKGNVVVPETVTYLGKTYEVTHIGKTAFEDSQELLSVKLPNNVTSIGDGAFSNTSVKYIIVPENSRLEALEGWALNGCSQLYKFDLPKNLKTIKKCAFQSVNIQTVILPNQCTDIGNMAFNAAHSKIVFVSYNTTPNIADDVFDRCENLHALYVPIGKKMEYSNATGWKKISNIVEYSNAVVDGVTYAYCPNENYATAYLANYSILPTELTLPEYINYNGNNIPVTRIEGSVFSDNINLRKVTIPSNVTFIEYKAFENCYALEEIYVRSEDPIVFTENTPFEGIDTNNCVLYVPKGCIEKYRSAYIWNSFENIKEYDATSIEIIKTTKLSNTDCHNLNGMKVKDDASNRIIIKKGKKYINQTSKNNK